MRKTYRLIAMLLTVVMIVTMMPVYVMASILDNSPEYNEEILAALEDIIGSEDEAKQYYSVLEQYGLLDEDGSFMENMSAVIDGVEYSKEELCELLKGDYDGDRIAVVDGMEITLDNLWNIIVIEGYIDYLRDTYGLDGEWTEESEKNYEDFLEQFTTKGVMLSLAPDDSLLGEYSGINHGAIVDIMADKPKKEGENYTVDVKASLSAAAEGQAVSFDYKTICGSAIVATTSGSITMIADSEGEAYATFTVTCKLESAAKSVAEAPVWYLNVFNLKNMDFNACLSVRCR